MDSKSPYSWRREYHIFKISMKLHERWLASLEIPECLHHIHEKIHELRFYNPKIPWVWIPYVWEFISLDFISNKVYESGFCIHENPQSVFIKNLTVWIPYPWPFTSLDCLSLKNPQVCILYFSKNVKVWIPYQWKSESRFHSLKNSTKKIYFFNCGLDFPLNPKLELHFHQKSTHV